jgi:hypothetical protein
MAIKVKALEMIFHGGRRYRPGAVLTLEPGYKPGKGMEVVGEVEEQVKPKPKAKAVAKEPETFSEITKMTLTKAPDGLV